MTRWLILVVTLAGSALLGYLIHRLSGSWTPRTRAPSMDPAVVQMMMTTMSSMVESMTTSTQSSISRLTELTEHLTIGREPVTGSEQTVTTRTTGMPTEQEMYAAIDGTPIPPGLSDLIAREDREEDQARLLQERQVFQARLARLRTEATDLGIDLSDLADLSPPPY